MTANLDLLSDSSPLTANVPLDNQVDAFKSAFKAAGFSEEYAEELIGSALVRHEMQDQTRKRKRRLIMFEKRVRQVADTVKWMAKDIPKEETAAMSLEECKKIAKGDMEAKGNLSSERYQRDDKKLVAELEDLANEGRIWISNAPSSSTSRSDDEVDWSTRQQNTGRGWYDGPAAREANFKLEDAYRKPESMSNKDAPSQSQSTDGLSWSDLLPEPTG